MVNQEKQRWEIRSWWMSGALGSLPLRTDCFTHDLSRCRSEEQLL